MDQKYIRNQHGITALVLLVGGAIVIAAAGFAGYQVYQAKGIDKNAHQTKVETSKPGIPPVQSAKFDQSTASLYGRPSPAPAVNPNANGSIKSSIDTGKFQAVLVHNGTSYDFRIGKLRELSPGKWQLKNTFSLKVAQGLTPLTGMQTQISLAKDQVDPLGIDASKVNQWSNLSDDHRYVMAIKEYEQYQK